MSNYTPATDFASKDALITGNPLKAIKGTEISAEFALIQTAVLSKRDSSSIPAVSEGGTGATTASVARTNLGAAASGANTDITSITGNAATATKLQGATWSVEESGGVLFFKVSGVNKAKLDASGNLTVIGNVTAYGTV